MKITLFNRIFETPLLSTLFQFYAITDMKDGLVIFIMVFCCITVLNGQQPDTKIQQISDCAPVTQRILQQYFTVERQMEIITSPVDLACLNYICAYSYEFAPGQSLLRSQKELFNIENFKHKRLVDQRISIYDEHAGVYVILFSWNEVEARLIAIRKAYKNAESN